MALQLATATVNAMADAATVLADDGAAGGTIKIYDGSQPATADTALSGQVLLATFTLADPAFAAAANGVATLDTTPALTTTGANTGTATWFRLADSNDATVLDGAVATSGAELNLNTTSISTGVNVEITSGTFTMPKSA